MNKVYFVYINKSIKLSHNCLQEAFSLSKAHMIWHEKSKGVVTIGYILYIHGTFVFLCTSNVKMEVDISNHCLH